MTTSNVSRMWAASSMPVEHNGAIVAPLDAYLVVTILDIFRETGTLYKVTI